MNSLISAESVFRASQAERTKQSQSQSLGIQQSQGAIAENSCRSAGMFNGAEFKLETGIGGGGQISEN